MPITYNTGYDDAQSVNESSRSTYIYKDLNLFFAKNPISDDVSKVTDVQAIKRSVRNLVLTNQGERLFHPEIGGNIYGTLFQHFTPITEVEIQASIEDVIRLWEPRVILEEVVVNEPKHRDIDMNQLRVTIRFSLTNIPNEIQEIEIFLNRIR